MQRTNKYGLIITVMAPITNKEAMHINMALRLWLYGPAVSVILTHNAPKDSVMPTSIIPNL